MRLYLAVAVLAASVSTASSFAPSSRWGSSNTALYSTLEDRPVDVSPTVELASQEVEADVKAVEGSAAPLTNDDINARLNSQLEKLRAKDITSRHLNKQVCLLQCSAPLLQCWRFRLRASPCPYLRSCLILYYARELE
jgi:hypothetical protein